MKRNYKGNPPNPLFEKWLTEMKEQAAANDNPIQYSFGKALTSLQKCPIRLETGKDCLILQHFGKKICEILDRKLEKYKKTNNLPSSSRPSSIFQIIGDDEDEDKDVGGKHAKKSKVRADKEPDKAFPESPVFKVPRNKPYIPNVGSGAHAILTTMYNSMHEPNYPGYMLKKDIISEAQKQCDSPMKSNAIEHYSGWTSMSTLIAKQYVIRKSNPAKYSLTDSGVALALSLTEGRAKHYRDSDDDADNECDDNACSNKEKPQNNSKGKKKSKASFSVFSASDYGKAPTSGLRKFQSRFNDSDDDGVIKQDYTKNLETNKDKYKEPKPAKLDNDLEAALAMCLLTETKSKKLFTSSPSKSETKTNAAFEDELEMALALSLNESKMKNDVLIDDHDDDHLNDYNKMKKNSTADKKDKNDEDEEFKRAIAISLNESKVKNDIDFGIQHDDCLSDGEEKKTKTETKSKKPFTSSSSKSETKTNPAFEDELEMALTLSLNENKMKNDVLNADYDDDDLKKALEMSMQEAKRKEAYSNDSFDELYGNEKTSENDFVSTNKFKVDAGPSSNKMDEVEIICLDDNGEDNFENLLKKDSEPKLEDSNIDNDESYIEFCKENAESVLHVKKKSEHFIFTEAPSDLYKKNDDGEKEVVNADTRSSPKKYDGGMNHDITNELQRSFDEQIDYDCQSVPKNTNLKDNSKKLDLVDEIVISDDDENVDYGIPSKVVTPSPPKNIRTLRKADKRNKENVQPAENFQREREVPKIVDLPSTTKNTSTNPPKSSKSTKEKENSQTYSQSKETPEEEPHDSFTLLPNNFDIVLLVDTQETSGVKKTKPTDDATMSALGDAGVLYEVRSLKVGDFAWIARCKFTQKELILPYIIERKRIDDLGGSITDGRYHEQKHRLRQSGINNVIYLIEHYGKTYHGALPLTSLFQAGINTTVQDGFITKFTKDHKDSMFYLAALTRKLIRMYKSKELISCPKKYVASASHMPEGTERLMEFTEFNKAALKTKKFTVREMLIKQLVQLKGISAEKAIGIAEMYPSPQLLSEAFKTRGKNLLADIEVGSARRKVGPAISNVLHLFYTRTDFN